MNLTHFEPDAALSTTVSRLARVLAERVDPDNEYDCKVAILTTDNDAIDEHGASDIPTGGYDYRYAELGLEIIIHFDANEDCPDIRISRLIDKYSDALDEGETVAHLSHFNGGDGRYHALAFPILDKELTFGVKDPSWA